MISVSFFYMVNSIMTEEKSKNIIDTESPKVANHLISRIGLGFIEPSLRSSFFLFEENIQYLNIFKDIPAIILTKYSDKEYKLKTAFLTPYHWDAFDCIERSIIDCMCTQYSASFTLLRMSFEMVLKGAFWQSMFNAQHRDNTQVLNEDKKTLNVLAKFKEEINDPNFNFNVSASIYDLKSVSSLKFNNSKTLKQISEWGITHPFNNVEEEVYEIYRYLCNYSHAHHDFTDTGTFITYKDKFLEREIVSEKLVEFNHILSNLLDFYIVLELQIFKDLICNNVNLKMTEITSQLDSKTTSLCRTMTLLDELIPNTEL